MVWYTEQSHSLLREPSQAILRSRPRRGSDFGADAVLHWMIVGLLAFLPLAFGAVEAWSEQIAICWSLLIGVCFCVTLIREPSPSLARSWALWPVAAFLLLAMLQLVPLPLSLLQRLSPSTTSLRAQLLGPQAASSAAPLTFYRLATEHELRLLVALCIVFAAALNLYTSVRRIRRLLVALSILGGLMAALALLQDLTGTSEIYWRVQGLLPRATAGTFIHYSHFSQFMTLSIGASLALFLLLMEEAFGNRHDSCRTVRIRDAIEALRHPQLRPIWLLAASIIVATTTIFLSLSRGGMIALLVSSGVTVIVLAARRGLGAQGWLIVLLSLASFTCVLYLGFDAVYNRLATLRNLPDRYQDRWQIVKDIGVVWTRFPLFGTGLGTHEFVYPMFDRSAIAALASHAENEYAQALEETGALGLAIIVSFIGAVAIHYYRALRSHRPALRPIAVGLGFGLLGILIHSWSDFGEHLPANAFFAAVLCAVLITVGQTARSSRRAAGRLEIHPAPRWAGWIGMAAMVILALAMVPAADAARRSETAWNRARDSAAQLEAAHWQGQNEDFAQLIWDAQTACSIQKEDAEYRYWLNVYRWRSISRDTDPKTGEVVMRSHTAQFTGRIIADLGEAEKLCPTFGPSYCLAGQLQDFVLHDPAGAPNIRKGYVLAPCDPVACFTAGWLDAHQGKWAESLEKFRRSQLLGTDLTAIAAVYIRQVGRPDLALALAGDDAAARLQVADLLAQTPGDEALSVSLRQAADRQHRLDLESRSLRGDASPQSLAELAKMEFDEGDYSKAVPLYRRALAGDFGRAQWRIALAQALVKSGRSDEALTEARICLRLRPDMDEALKLVTALDMRDDKAPGE